MSGSKPVDTDALRDEAKWMQETLGPWLKRHGLITNSGDVQLIAAGHIIAADELDRLRPKVARQQSVNASNIESMTGVIDRLRKLIQGAPHAEGCTYGNSGQWRVPCTCWKADAL